MSVLPEFVSNHQSSIRVRAIAASIGLVLLGSLAGCSGSATTASTGTSDQAVTSVEILNASYDPTRELWKDLNAAFVRDYEKDSKVKVKVKQSHGASGSQARAIIDGLSADVATLSLWSDTDQLRKKGLLEEGWLTKLPNRSLPYTSTVIFVVRKGNPKGIHQWSDLVKPDVSIITPNPKTSGNGKLSFLAAWGSVILNGGSEADAKSFVTTIYKNTPVLDTGARGATTTFSQKGIGDVHLTMESEAFLEVHESKGELEIVYPKQSILHEPHVTVVDKNVDEKKTRAVAEAYLKFLYTKEGQEIIAKHHFRPTDPEVLAKHQADYQPIELFPVTKIVSDWNESQSKFFAEGALFDQIYTESSNSK